MQGNRDAEVEGIITVTLSEIRKRKSRGITDKAIRVLVGPNVSPLKRRFHQPNFGK